MVSWGVGTRGVPRQHCIRSAAFATNTCYHADDEFSSRVCSNSLLSTISHMRLQGPSVGSFSYHSHFISKVYLCQVIFCTCSTDAVLAMVQYLQ